MDLLTGLVAGGFAGGHHGDESENEPDHQEYKCEDVQHKATENNDTKNEEDRVHDDIGESP